MDRTIEEEQDSPPTALRREREPVLSPRAKKLALIAYGGLFAGLLVLGLVGRATAPGPEGTRPTLAPQPTPPPTFPAAAADPAGTPPPLRTEVVETPAPAEDSCHFVLGFADLRQTIGPEVVGDCVENQHYDPETGDALQRTTKGLLVWRKNLNSAAFTDGHRTWAVGPNGLEERPNSERFDWER